ncbi:hypothetical protein L596_002569 [Steinernema carpocapsae]|uniref:Uncharacterized protein n=1 Tax=Steinernema carpocapsae TaxID=34508 RepID=A0A4V6I7R7_STECR|nr:hypothetical protein L596_002569 [Steinernema carpocapsae]
MSCRTFLTSTIGFDVEAKEPEEPGKNYGGLCSNSGTFKCSLRKSLFRSVRNIKRSASMVEWVPVEH